MKAKPAELITIKQLPVIQQKLKSINAEICENTSAVLALECNADTVKQIKALRAGLNKDFEELETCRKKVKNAVLKPYEQFEDIYKDCVTSVFNKADAELKHRIEEVENDIKQKRQRSVEAYFEEYKESKNIDFVTFDDAGIKITLSASLQSFKEAVKNFLDRIYGDLRLIDTQKYKEEILVEYKQSLNVSEAVTSVTERHKAIAEEKARRPAQEAKPEYDDFSYSLSAPAEVKPPLKLTFTVIAARDKLKELKQFLQNGDYQIL